MPCPKARSWTPQHTSPARFPPGAEESDEGGGKGGDDIDNVKLNLELNYANFSNGNDCFLPQPFAQRSGVRKSNFLSAYRSLRHHSTPQYQSEFIVDLKAPSPYRSGRFEVYHMRMIQKSSRRYHRKIPLLTPSPRVSARERVPQPR